MYHKSHCVRNEFGQREFYAVCEWSAFHTFLCLIESAMCLYAIWMFVFVHVSLCVCVLVRAREWSMKAENGLENRTLENVLEWLCALFTDLFSQTATQSSWTIELKPIGRVFLCFVSSSNNRSLMRAWNVHECFISVFAKNIQKKKSYFVSYPSLNYLFYFCVV